MGTVLGKKITRFTKNATRRYCHRSSSSKDGFVRESSPHRQQRRRWNEHQRSFAEFIIATDDAGIRHADEGLRRFVHRSVKCMNIIKIPSFLSREYKNKQTRRKAQRKR